MVDGSDYFTNFVGGDGRRLAAGRPGMFNPTCENVMVTTKIGIHSVEMYDAIDELPIVRFHKYQKMLLIDAGIGSDITAFDQRTEKARRYLADGKPEKASTELENLRLAVHLIQQDISPKHRAFAVLVKSIDGAPCDDLSDAGLDAVLEKLKSSPIRAIAEALGGVKKKIEDELVSYFPRLFNDSEVKEYFDILRRRTLAVLNNIVAGLPQPDRTDEVEKLTTRLITYSNPKVFSGSDGMEIQYDRQFETLCLSLSEQLHVEPKKMSVLEFYNAFDFVQERAKSRERGQKRP